MSVFSRGAYTMMWYEGFGADEALLIANHHTLTAGRHHEPKDQDRRDRRRRVQST